MIRVRRRLEFVACVVAFLGLAVLLAHAPGTLYSGSRNSDLVNSFYPHTSFLQRWMDRGILPLWSPHAFNGYPVIEALQLSPLYAPRLVLLWLKLGPEQVLTWSTVFHTGLALFGMRYLLRCLGVYGIPCVVGSLLFVLGGIFPLRIQAGHVTVVAVLAWWPWCMALLWNSLRQRRARWWRAVFAGGCMVGATLYAGAPQYTIYLGYLLAVTCAVHVLRLDRTQRLRGSWYAARNLGLMCGLGGALALPIVYPAAVYFGFTHRASVSNGSISPMDWRVFGLENILPFPFGNDMDRWHVHYKNVWETAHYLGVGAASFILGGVLAWPFVGRRRMLQPAYALGILLLAASAYFALGGWGPGMDGFRDPLKVRAVFSLACALLLAATLQIWLRGSRAASIGALVAASLLAVFIVVHGLVFNNQPDAFAELYLTRLGCNEPLAAPDWVRAIKDSRFFFERTIPAHQFAAVVGIVSVVVCGATLVLGQKLRTQAVVALALMMVVDVAWAHWGCWYARHEFSRISMPESLRRDLQAAIADPKGTDLPYRVTLPAQMMNRGFYMDGLYDTGGYDPLMPGHANSRHVLDGLALHREIQLSTPTLARLKSEAFGRRVDLMRWNQARGTGVYPEDWDRPDIEAAKAVAQSGTASMVQISRQVEFRVPVEACFGPTANGTHLVDPGQSPEGWKYHQDDPTSPSRPVARIADSDTPNGWSFEVGAGDVALLVVRQTWLPGWRARTKIGTQWGPWQPAVRTDGWATGVWLPNRSCVVEFDYLPPGWPWLWIPVAGLLTLGLLGCAPWHRKAAAKAGSR